MRKVEYNDSLQNTTLWKPKTKCSISQLERNRFETAHWAGTPEVPKQIQQRIKARRNENTMPKYGGK